MVIVLIALNFEGINLNTEISYIYSQSESRLNICKINQAPKEIESRTKQWKLLDGIFYENSNTMQPNIKASVGVEDARSGDGTVPYSSLNFCSKWADSIPELTIDELHHVEHRSILGNRLFWKKVLLYVCRRS
jgi:hypothetical protein